MSMYKALESMAIQRKLLGGDANIACILIDILPCGSGINSGWTISQLKNGNIICRNSFQLWNCVGYYDGYQDFYVKIYRKGDEDFSVHLSGQMRKTLSSYGLREYLTETIYHALDGAGLA